ncbi:MAG TPA: response regulator [Geobacteraceae bacterium]|nr:response regulator [Geobacteraceae bacterium]
MPDPDRTKISLLYVEDDLISMDLVRQLIAMKYPSLELYTAENGRSGLDLFREWMPQIVMTDIKMPIMDGVSMVSEIKALRPETIVVIVAANCDADYLLNDSVIDFCIAKPIDYRILFTVIENCIASIKESSRQGEQQIVAISMVLGKD